MKVNIALLTVTDTRTFENGKSGSILVKKIEEAKHSLIGGQVGNFLNLKVFPTRVLAFVTAGLVLFIAIRMAYKLFI